MGLDDAIDAARRRAEFMDTQQRQEADRHARERMEALELLAEAVRRLAPYRSGTYARMRRSTFGRYRGPGGHRYTEAERQRCWLLVSRESTHPQSGQWYASPILLLENATAVQVWLDFQSTEPDQYISSLDPMVVGLDGASLTLGGSNRTGWVDELKEHLARAVVRYERGQ
ncbi:hypothetical protein ACFWBI_36900 [Streptomyces sp. NPDC059982]|uniref:hypothetical protein n=1 Tax=unclassified Streptomyces TaxID=2593676 RepID=UPI0036AAD96D